MPSISLPFAYGAQPSEGPRYLPWSFDFTQAPAGAPITQSLTLADALMGAARGAIIDASNCQCQLNFQVQDTGQRFRVKPYSYTTVPIFSGSSILTLTGFVGAFISTPPIVPLQLTNIPLWFHEDFLYTPSFGSPPYSSVPCVKTNIPHNSWGQLLQPRPTGWRIDLTTDPNTAATGNLQIGWGDENGNQPAEYFAILVGPEVNYSIAGTPDSPLPSTPLWGYNADSATRATRAADYYG
jgi:hypothetical protein